MLAWLKNTSSSKGDIKVTFAYVRCKDSDLVQPMMSWACLHVAWLITPSYIVIGIAIGGTIAILTAFSVDASSGAPSLKIAWL
jgi:hypothetical protein